MTVLERIVSVGFGGVMLVAAWFLFRKRRSLQEVMESAGGLPTPPFVVDVVAAMGALLLAVPGVQRVLSGILG